MKNFDVSVNMLELEVKLCKWLASFPQGIQNLVLRLSKYLQKNGKKRSDFNESLNFSHQCLSVQYLIIAQKHKNYYWKLKLDTLIVTKK